MSKLLAVSEEYDPYLFDDEDDNEEEEYQEDKFDEDLMEKIIFECQEDMLEYTHSAIIPLCERLTYGKLYNFIMSIESLQ